jgi:pimeloyl-ACP methyl ester carboxylesterase
VLHTDDEIVRGVRSAIHDSGPATGSEAVVFVHGNPGPLDDWEDIAPEVARFARVIAPDMPGFGRADRPRDFDYTIGGYAEHLDGLLRARGIARAHLVLHDFGGGWGLRWAAKHPKQVASITLINCGIMPGYRWHIFARIWQTPGIGELFQLISSAGAVRRTFKAQKPKPMPDHFIERVLRYADWGHKRAVLKLYRSARKLEAQYPTLEEAAQFAETPACVLWGADDPFLPVRYAELQRQFLPRAEVHSLPGLGHWPFVDDLDAVREPLLAFLRRQFGAPLLPIDRASSNVL